MQQFSMYNIIDKKKNGETLSNEEIKWVIQRYTAGKIQDYQLSALLMAIFLKGFNTKETAALTDAMLYSGKVLSFEGNDVIDKHSTGGVGDKTSFILTPIAAACGVKVPMIAGRGLGFTGGTIDKVESIKGYKTNLGLDQFSKLLQKNGQVLIGQTKQIAPADRLIYALRDVTATIDSIPLITASIMSKKLAEGANGVVMDIKLGSGAFMRKKSEAKKLGMSIIKTAERFDKKAVALITNMNQPLGNAVGNSLEIIESVEVLKGNGPKDLTDLSLELASWMIYLAGKEKTISKARTAAKKALKSGAALKKFKELIKTQGGHTNFDKLPLAKTKTQVLAPKSGYIKSFVCDQIGLLCTEIGGGRKVKSDKIDHGVGFYFHKKLSDKVSKGSPILTIYHNKDQQGVVEKMIKSFQDDVITISKTKPQKPELVYEILKGKKC